MRIDSVADSVDLRIETAVSVEVAAEIVAVEVVAIVRASRLYLVD